MKKFGGFVLGNEVTGKAQLIQTDATYEEILAMLKKNVRQVKRISARYGKLETFTITKHGREHFGLKSGSISPTDWKIVFQLVGDIFKKAGYSFNRTDLLYKL